MKPKGFLSAGQQKSTLETIMASISSPGTNLSGCTPHRDSSDRDMVQVCVRPGNVCNAMDGYQETSIRHCKTGEAK